MDINSHIYDRYNYVNYIYTNKYINNIIPHIYIIKQSEKNTNILYFRFVKRYGDVSYICYLFMC